MLERTSADLTQFADGTEPGRDEISDVRFLGTAADMGVVRHSRFRSHATYADAEPRRQLTLLLIDSENKLNQWVQEYCDILGWAVHFAADGLDGLTMAFKRPYDAILIGRKLSTVSSIKLAEMVRDCPGKNIAAPLLLMTENPTMDDSKECRRLKLDLIEQQPVLLSDFRTIIQRLT